MENEAFIVTIEFNGTLTVVDKRTEKSYSRLLTFEDAADIGDGWYYGPAVNDQKFISTSGHSDVALVSDGPLFCQFRVRTTLSVPRAFDFITKRRDKEFTPIVIDSLITLRQGGDRIEVQSTVDNTAKDHRMRVFPQFTTTSFSRRRGRMEISSNGSRDMEHRFRHSLQAHYSL